MADINKVVLIGRLTKDVESKQYSESVKYSFTLAVNKRIKENGQWKDEGRFFEIETWNIGKIAEYMTKGRQVAIEGELDTYAWEKDGKHYSKTFVRADIIQLLQSSSKDGQAAGASPRQTTQAPQRQEQMPVDDDDMDSIPF